MHFDTLTPAQRILRDAAHDPLEQPAHEPMPHQFLSSLSVRSVKSSD